MKNVNVIRREVSKAVRTIIEISVEEKTKEVVECD